MRQAFLIGFLLAGWVVAASAAEAPASVTVLVAYHSVTGHTEKMAQGVVEGAARIPGTRVVLKYKGASRKHAQLKLRDGTWTLTDLGSTNGTRLNGQTVQSRELADGDKITIGTTLIEFQRD